MISRYYSFQCVFVWRNRQAKKDAGRVPPVRVLHLASVPKSTYNQKAPPGSGACDPCLVPAALVIIFFLTVLPRCRAPRNAIRSHKNSRARIFFCFFSFLFLFAALHVMKNISPCHKWAYKATLPRLGRLRNFAVVHFSASKN